MDDKADDGSEFRAQMTKDRYVLSDGKLVPIPAATFSRTRLYIVYYSHIDCTVCVPTTEAVSRWYWSGSARRCSTAVSTQLSSPIP
jgi:hypothetical protein